MTYIRSCPILIGIDDRSVSLAPLALSGTNSTAVYDERWLQNLLYHHPETLPVEEIDGAYTGLIPICTELSLGSAGYVDLLYATPSGRIAVLEAKLWRNPEARRKVIGQILHYATALSQWTYSTLDAKVRAARASESKAGAPSSIFEVVNSATPGVDEAMFVDAVSRSLQRGEFLLLIAGDGIHESVGEITEFLEGHGTLHFSFGLVELCIYKMPDGAQLVQPRVLARSEIVRRVVVEVRGDRVTIADGATTAVDDGAGGDADPELSKTRETFQAFWREFLAELRLDDASQPIGQPSRSTNQYFYLSRGTNAWVSAYISQSVGQCGVYLTFERGGSADRLYAALFAEKDAIDKELAIPVEWESNDGKHMIIARRPYPGKILNEHRSDAKTWLADRVNRFVTVFRTRLEAILREDRPA